MASNRESILFPEKSLYLIHKIQDKTAASQWQTRPKVLRSALPPAGNKSKISQGVSQRTIERKENTNAPVRFIHCNVEENHRRPKKKLQRTRNLATFKVPKKSQNRQFLGRKKQQSKNAGAEHRDCHHAVIEPALGPVPDIQILNLAVPSLSDGLPPPLSRHAILYINFCR